MKTTWKSLFSKSDFPCREDGSVPTPLQLGTLGELRRFLDVVHIRHCLVRPYFETEDYPLVEARELLPSFESDMWEYKQLPGFSLVALARPLSYFQEIFQFDILHPVLDSASVAEGASCPLESHVIARNVQTMQMRLPKAMQDSFRQRFSRMDTSVPDYYGTLTPYLLAMDRGQVFAHDGFGHFHLAGVYASFPSDLDNEIKRFGLRIGKFAVGDDDMYERNRLFVYQYLMELYGFPIVSERRTSSALFARRLHKMGEKFLIRVLGQSDRTITTISNEGGTSHYPRLDKIALVRIDSDQEDALQAIDEMGAFLDRERRVVIMRVSYKQHRFNPDNVRQDRALSVDRQEIIHPLTGEPLPNMNIIKDTSNMFLRLNDIVRGEYTGRIVYKRTEIVENTDTDEKRLKFLFSWLSKHQRRMIGYSDEFFSNVSKVLDNYLLTPDNYESFGQLHDLYQEVWAKYSYIQQARKVRFLEDIQNRLYRGERIGYRRMLAEAVALLHGLKFEIVSYFDTLVASVIRIGEAILNDRYLLRTYIERRDEELTRGGQEIRKNYGRLVSLIDEFKAIRRSRHGKHSTMTTT